MTKHLIMTLVTLASAMSYAQLDDYEIETVEKNLAQESDADTRQYSNSKAANEAYNTKDSPQIHIYNANSNANKQNQKNNQDQELDSDVKSSTDAYANSDAGVEYISRANDIRNSRKNMEVGTEQKMIEKIEWSRIEDEKDRADRLFGNRLEKKDKYKNDDYENDYKDEYKTEKVIVIEKPSASYTAPAPTPAPVYNESYAETKVEEKSSTWWGSETYISPVVGSAAYNSADNVRGDMSIGVLLGTRFDSNVSIEGGFLYSDYEMDDYTTGYYNNPGLKDVTQYNFVGGVKYNFDLGRISPHIGAVMGYTYRQYDERKFTADSTDSNAFDAGLSAGVDIKLAKNFSLGAEYRWMRNITYDRSESNVQSQTQQVMYNHPSLSGQNLRPLEELNYQMFLVNGKFTF